jgi:hypothetical protein
MGKGDLSGNPKFVSATDYHLQSDSPAKRAGSDGLDLGVYPSGSGQVGPDGTVASAPKPNPPTSVTVQ